MIAISVKKDRVNFLSVFRSKSEIVINDFGVIHLKSNKIDSKVISNILNRKKIRNSKILSKKCIIMIDFNEVLFNQINISDKIDIRTSVRWNSELFFNSFDLERYNDFHYQMSKNNNLLSIYIEKDKQSSYYNLCKKSDLDLLCLSLNIFSAEYLAREVFEAKNNSSYAIWAVGTEKDDLMIIEDNEFVGLISFKRLKKSVEFLNHIGPREYLVNCVNKMSKDQFSDLKSVDCVNKIYIYQKSLNTDMKKIIKKNKEGVVILNPLLKIDSFKKGKNEDVNSSFLSEMGFFFKFLGEKSA